jgi:hypothetical protein
MKLNEFRYHFYKVSHRRERRERRDYLKISFSAFSASSAVNDYVSFSIRSVAFQAGGWARMKLHPKFEWERFVTAIKIDRIPLFDVSRFGVI